MEKSDKGKKQPKQQLQDIAESMLLFKAIVENGSDWTYWLDSDGNLKYISPAFERITGFSLTELKNNPHLFSDLIHYDDRQKWEEHLKHHFENKETYQGEFRIFTKNNQTRWIKHECKPVYDDNNNLLGSWASNRDITECKKAEEARRKNEEKYRTLVSSMSDIIFLLDKEDRFVDVYCREDAPLYMSLDLFLGKKYQDIMPPHLNKLYNEAAAKVRKTGKTQKFDYHIQIDEEEKWFSAALDLFKDKESIVAAIRDITDRKKMEEALCESKKKYRSTIENIPLGILTIDKNGVISFVNKSFTKIFNLPSEKVIGKTIADSLSFITGTNFINHFTALMENNTKFDFETQAITLPSGNIVYLRCRGIPVKNVQGNVESFLLVMGDITERKKIEEKLRESEEEYRAINNSVLDAVVLMDDNGNVVSWNPAAERMFGYTRDEIIGKNVHATFMSKRYLSKFKKGFGKFKKTGKGNIVGKVVEFMAKRKNGDKIPVELIISPIYLKGKYWTSAVIRDVTDRKRAEKNLQQQLSFARALNNLVQNIILEDDRQMLLEAMVRIAGETLKVDRSLIYEIDLKKREARGLCEWLNPQAGYIMPTVDTYKMDLFKESLEYITSTHNWLESHADNVNKFIKAESSDKILHEQMQIKSLLWFPFAFDTQKYYLLVFNHVRQIHKWQKTELSFNEALASQVEMALMKIRLLNEQMRVTSELRRLATVVEQASEAIVVTDTQGIIEYVNPAFEKITEYMANEALGQNPRILKSGKQQKEFYEELWETIQQGRTWNGRFINRKKDGTEYPEEAVIFPIKNADGQIVNYCKISRDITHELELERQLQQAQKMEAVGTLAGGVAHDFNNLLTVINGYTELSLMKLEKNKPFYNEFMAIRNAGKRAKDLTNQLLAFSRKQIQKPEIININQVVLSMNKILRRLISEDIYIETILTENLPTIKADPMQIEQILTNLAVNARDAVQAVSKSGFKKKITIETGSVFLDKEYVSGHPGSQTGRHVFLSVSDNGIGMDAQTKQRIFEPFFTTKAKYKGTGLGLSMVYGIVKQNKGSVYVYSEPGQGTTFKIYWPITKEIPKTQQKAVEQKDLSGTESILIVEDNDEVRKFSVSFLSSLGYNVHQAANGEVALKFIESESFPIDLLITDLIMPEMNGKELADKITSKFPQIKIIFMSGYTDNYILHNGNLDEGVNFINKPFSLETLAMKVRQVLNRD